MKENLKIRTDSISKKGTLMNESILYTYAMLFLNTYKKLMFSAGSSYYHNAIIIGIVQLQQQGTIEIEWKSAALPEGEQDRLHLHAWHEKEETASMELPFLKRIKPLSNDLQEYKFLYDRIPKTQPINLIHLIKEDYRSEINKKVTNMQEIIERGLLERNMAFQTEKKRLLGKARTILLPVPAALENTATYIRTILNQEQPMSEQDFILCYLVKIERMLPSLYDKQEAKNLYDKIESISQTKPYSDGNFLKLTNLVQSLEESVFLTFTLSDE